MSALLNLGDKITAGNRADATFFYKKRVADDSGTLLTEAETDENNRELLAQKLFDKASIVYTAGGVKAGTNYSVKGTDFTVTRAGVKNVVNRAGVLTEIPANTPATEFANGVLKGTLIEPARTNLVLRSEEFDNAYWASTDVTITPNAVIAPNGEQTADNITFSEASGNVRITLSGFAVVSGSTITISLYAKTSVQIVTFGGATTIAGTNVYSFEDVGNGYFRQKVTRTYSASGTSNAQFLLNNTNFGAGTVAVWGAQLETGSVATSYIKTVDTTITQPADVITATGVSGLANGQGTVLIAFTPLNLPATTYHRLFAVDNGTSSDNGYDIGYGDAGGALARTTFRIGGATSFDSTAGAVTIGQRQIVAFAFANNDFQVALNGTLQGASASGSTNIQHSRIIIGGRSDGTGNNAIEEVYYFPTRLTNAELETLTTP
jgi:hypothetical protein